MFWQTVAECDRYTLMQSLKDVCYLSSKMFSSNTFCHLSSNMLVIESEARDLGSCLRWQVRWHGQEPRSLALLGMTNFL